MTIEPKISKSPVRGAQSFVGIMGEVWHRPSLSALEISWRWFGGTALVITVFALSFVFRSGEAAYGLDISPIRSLSLFQPVAAVQAVQQAVEASVMLALIVLGWPILIAFLLWHLLAAFGRTLALRRYGPALHTRRLALFFLGTLRATLLLGAWLLWFELIAFSARVTITAPAARGEEPSVVLFAAMTICGTLLLYVLWAALCWFLYLAPLLAMRRNLGALAALHAAFASSKELRGKLIEINLVMNIVRIALLVLAMVVSATPLPFTAVATPEFLHLWWAGVVLLYLAACDYFHVVRAASYLSLDRVYNS